MINKFYQWIHKITSYINVSPKTETKKFLNLKSLSSKVKKKEYLIMSKVYFEAGNQTIFKLYKLVWTTISNIASCIGLLSLQKLKFQK